MDQTEKSQHPHLLSNIKQKAIMGPVITKNRDLKIGISIRNTPGSTISQSEMRDKNNKCNQESA